MKRTFFYFISLLIWFSANTQTKLNLYFSGDNKDTVNTSVVILQQMLTKSTGFSFVSNPEKSFNGTGFLLSSQPALWPLYSAALKKLGQEGVIVKSTDRSVLIIGNTQLAVQHGVFIYLEKLGYHFYFPHPDWYIIPNSPDLFKKIDYTGQPSFDHRRIWYGYGTGSPKSDADYDFWFKANRQGGSMNANFGQAYDDIVYRNQEEFKKHPEWFYPQPAKGQIPNDPKFNLANEKLIQFVISDVFKRIEKSKQTGTADYKMISMSPSDGLGTCNTPECQQLGSLTDRVYYLVNRVAKAVRQKYPGTWIGGYAYSEFIAPPSAKLEPNVFVGITTAFNYSKYSIDELVKLWSQKAGKTGIYDYFSNYAWDQDVPGQSLASRPGDVIKNITKYYKMGSRGYEAESTTGWVSKGLGHFLGAQLMWDINSNSDQLKTEFFSNCFGKAASTIRKLFEGMESNGFATPRESDLTNWVNLVNTAGEQEKDAKVQQRFFHIRSYLYYLMLLRRYKETKTDTDLVALLNYGYRMMDYGSFAGYPSLFELGNLSPYPGMKFGDPDARYKSSRAIITPAEMDKLLAAEQGRLKKFGDKKVYAMPVSFVKATGTEKWQGPSHDGSQGDNKLWYPHDFIIQVVKSGKENYFDFTGGYVTGGGGESPISITVIPYAAADDSQIPLLSYNYTGKMTTERINLESLKPGFYKLSVKDPLKIFKIDFSNAINFSLLISAKNKLNSNFCNNLFAFVPKDVTAFRVWKNIVVRFQTPAGRIVNLESKGENETEVQVLPGEAGLWKIIFFSGALYIDGLPPVLGFNPARMLIPAGIQ